MDRFLRLLVLALLFQPVQARCSQGEGGLVEALELEQRADGWLARGLVERAGELYGEAAEILERLGAGVDPQDGGAGVVEAAAERLPEAELGAHRARVMARVGAVRAREGRLKEAERWFVEALGLAQETLGERHPETVQRVGDLALFLSRELGRHRDAEALLKEVETWLEEQGRGQALAELGRDLGRVYLRGGRHELAQERLGRRYVELRGEPLAAAHRVELAASAMDLAQVHWARGEMEPAIELWSEACELRAAEGQGVLALGAEPERLAHAARVVEERSMTLSLHLLGAPEDPRAAALALEHVVRTRGRELEARADAFRRVQGQGREAFAELAELRLRRALGEESGVEPEADLARLEQELTAASPLLGDLAREARLEDLRRRLLGHAALVEFVRYQPFDVRRRRFGAPHYAVYVLRGEGEVVGLDLGEAQEIDQGVEALRSALVAGVQVDALARALHETLVQPWLAAAGEDTHLMIVPDGLLELLPFEVLADPRGQSLLARRSTSYLGSARELLRPQADADGLPVVLADPELGSTGDTAWAPLPGTRREAERVAEVLGEVRLLVGKAASEEALRGTRRPRVLHLATHACLVGGEGGSAGDIVLVGEDARDAVGPARPEAPLVQAAVVLFGANRDGQEPQRDGFLRAIEVPELDLAGTEVVVLGCCGAPAMRGVPGEGVFGLRRAFALAGAESVVMSLWAVEDEARSELMVRFHRALAEGRSRAGALREARMALAGDGRFAHPSTWGAFVLSGEWDAP